MKINRLFIVLSGLFLIVVSCAEYDRFERIENDKLRIIAVKYDGAAEFAPGDTATGKVYFAGNAIASVGDFSIAYVHQYNKNNIFPDEQKIDLLDTTLWFPDSMQFRYIIPNDVFLTKKVYGLEDTAMIRKLHSLATLVSVYDDTLLPPVSEDTLEQLMVAVNSLYAQPSLFFYANSVNGTRLKVRSEFVIRYNSLFPNYLPVNNNPQVKWMAIYRVPSNSSENFYPHNPDITEKTTVTYLYNEYNPESVADTIVIDTGYTYYLACNQGIDFHLSASGDTVGDTTCDFITIPGDTTLTVPEEYSYEWFFQNLDDIDDIQDSLLVLLTENSGSGTIEIKAPVNTAMKRFKIWVVVHDFVTGMYSRPKGFAVGTGEGVFKYTDEYKKSVE
ncbi:MAG TPA: hypothetical protein VHO70_23010 [Chitinispirillaceae bacterium]|nr:hypothetical protein [Chitinispirillaceae bacterium]